MRLKRGTLAGEKIDGHWFVYLDSTEQPTEQKPTTDPTVTEQPTQQQNVPDGDTAALVTALQDQISFLQDQLRNRDFQIQTLIAKIPNPEQTVPTMIEAGEFHQDTHTAPPGGPGREQVLSSTPKALWRLRLPWRRR